MFDVLPKSQAMKKLNVPLFMAIAFLNISNSMAQNEFRSGVIGIGVVVHDLEKALDFYINVIGMQKTREFDVDAELASSTGLSNGVPFHVDVLSLVDSPDATNWKLLSFNKEGSHPKPAFIQDDTGMQYITIQLNSLAPVLKRIKKHKVKMLGETPTPLPGGERHLVLVQDPDGTFVELIGTLN
jgi:catechol 2,3-dioxygenase-like lactoylglutathione lyase family enzyme